MPFLRQSTQVIEMFGPFVDATDGVSEEVGLAGGGTEISKAGAAFATGPVLGTHDAEGWYPITLTTAHTGTLGQLAAKSQNSGTHLPVWKTWTVVPAAVYDSLVNGNDTLPADVTQWLGTGAPAAPPSNAEMEARTLVAAAYFDPAADTVATVTDVSNLHASAATSAAQTTAQNDLDTLTGTDGATLATTQALYAPAKAGDAMDLVTDSVDAAAVAAGTVTEIQSGLATAASIAALNDFDPATDTVGNVTIVATVTNRVTANTDQLAGNGTAATLLSASARGIVSTTVNDASATITSFVTALTEATDDHYNGRVIIFLTGTLAGQATDITDYTGATKTVTVTALTEAPANSVSFVIV